MSVAPAGIDQGQWDLAELITLLQQAGATPTAQQIASVNAKLAEIQINRFGKVAVQTPPG